MSVWRVQEVQSCRTNEDVENLMLRRGEDIVDTIGGEVDRIERNLKVSIGGEVDRIERNLRVSIGGEVDRIEGNSLSHTRSGVLQIALCLTYIILL